MKQYKRVVTIAGSDSGGGAGIQADLKTFSACGCYGMSVITAITAQNTCGVQAIHPVPVAMLKQQLQAVLEDIGADAIKIGMLHSAEVIKGVAEVLAESKVSHVVLDPVMVATSGDSLIEEEAVAAMKEYLFPLVSLITPNIPEAEILLGKNVVGDDLQGVAEELALTFSLSALAKAGHQQAETLTDVLYDWDNRCHHTFSVDRIATKNSHGTGCTLSSAIAAFLAHGYSLDQAVSHASKYLHGALLAGSEYSIGGGHGPVHHFYREWS